MWRKNVDISEMSTPIYKNKSIKDIKPKNDEENKIILRAIKKGIEIGVNVYIDEPKYIYYIRKLHFIKNYDNDFNGKLELSCLLQNDGGQMDWNALCKRLHVIDNKQISIQLKI